MAANRRKTIEYVLAPRLTQLPTNTTLGTSTRYDTASFTVSIPETTSRNFLSVRLVATCWGEYTTTGITLVGFRMGSKVGAATAVDVDRAPALGATASKDTAFRFDLDVTSNFNTNFGAGTSATFVGSLAVATSTAANVNGVTLKLIVTYEFDSTAQNTRIKTIRIPMQSQITTLTTVQQEIGTDGTNPAPANQIPALDTFLPEASKVYRQIVIESEANMAMTAVTTTTPFIQIDSVAETARAPISVPVGASKYLLWLDHIDITGAITTNAAHAFKMRCDVAARLPSVSAVLIVTYEYSVSATAAAGNTHIVEAMIPLACSDDDIPSPGQPQLGPTTTAADALRLWAIFDVQDASPTLVQSAAFLWRVDFSSTVQMNVRAGGQAYRATTTVATAGPVPMRHRVDHGTTPWALARGPNRLSLDIYLATVAGRTGLIAGFAIINYTATMPTDPDTATHVLNYFGHGYDNALSGATGVDVPASGGGQVAPVLGTPAKVQAVWLDAWYHASSAVPPQLYIAENAGEYDASGYVLPVIASAASQALIASWPACAPITKHCNADTLHTGKLDATQTHRIIALIASGGTGSIVASWSTWITTHQLPFTVSGTVTINGAAAANGNSVKIYAYDANGLVELVATVAISGGAGGFTTPVLDNTRTYFSSYNVGFSYGRSADATPGTAMNVVINSSAGSSGGVSRSQVVNA